eukprot:scaffold2830_cov123-Isochrysis_galbana.AAC.20
MCPLLTLEAVALLQALHGRQYPRVVQRYLQFEELIVRLLRARLGLDLAFASLASLDGHLVLGRPCCDLDGVPLCVRVRQQLAVRADGQLMRLAPALGLGRPLAPLLGQQRVQHLQPVLVGGGQVLFCDPGPLPRDGE